MCEWSGNAASGYLSPPSLSPNQFLTDSAWLRLTPPTSSFKVTCCGWFQYPCWLWIYCIWSEVSFPRRIVWPIPLCQWIYSSGWPHSRSSVVEGVDNLVFDWHVSDLLTDHSTVHWFARASHPVRSKKAVTFRDLKSDLDLFATDP